MTSYEALHLRLLNHRGRASDYECSCGKEAADWAYQHNGDQELYDDLGNVYALDEACYLPMCRSCHRKLDLEHNPAYREWLTTSGAVRAREVLALEHADKMKEVGKRLGNSTVKRRQEDPEFDERLRSAARKNIYVALATPQDPEKVSRDRARAAQKANATQRCCSECGLTAHPAALGAHQKASGHRGYTIKETT